MARRQVQFFAIIDYDDEKFSPEFMSDNELVTTILNRHRGIQDEIVGAFPSTRWRLSFLHNMN